MTTEMMMGDRATTFMTVIISYPLQEINNACMSICMFSGRGKFTTTIVQIFIDSSSLCKCVVVGIGVAGE